MARQMQYTTPEQAEELIAAGMNKSSADCWRQSPTSDIFVRCAEELRPDFFEGTSFLPCWSLGQLIFIYTVCAGQSIILKEFKGSTLIERMMVAILYMLKGNTIDFSRLNNL